MSEKENDLNEASDFGHEEKKQEEPLMSDGVLEDNLDLDEDLDNLPL